jgi:hypothetical protein
MRASSRFFAAHGTVDVASIFRMENAFYYSFYDQLVQADSTRDALRLLLWDRLSEAPDVINALRRFNIHQELLTGLAWRACRALGWGHLDPAAFYCCAVFAVYLCGLLGLAACAPRGSGVLCVGALFVFLCGAIELSTRVDRSPPLRESAGVAFWFISCAALQSLLHAWAAAPAAGSDQSRSDGTRLRAAALVLGTTGLLLAWQFACFSLLVQLASLWAAALCCGGSSYALVLVARTSRMHLISLLLASALRLGDLWALRSLFASVVIAFIATDAIVRRVARPPRWSLALAFVSALVAMRVLTRWALVAVEGELALEDDAHIVEFASHKLGWRSGPAGYHASLYLGQHAFFTPSMEDWRELASCSLLPGALLSALAITINWIATVSASGDTPRLPRAMPLLPQVWLLALTGATGARGCP